MSTRSSARNLFPPLDNPELTIRRRSRTDPTLLNDSEMAAEGNGDLPVPDLRIQNSCQFHGLPGDDANKHLDKFLHVTQSIKVNGVTDDALCLYIFPHSLTHHGTAWFDRLPRNSINTFQQMAKMFLGTFMKWRLEECYDLIENMTAYHNDWDTSAQWSESSSSITSSFNTEITALKAEMAEINKNLMRVLQVNQQVKAVTPSCEACGGPHSFSDCPATVGNTQNFYAAGAYQGNSYQPQGNRNLLSYRLDNYLGPPGQNQPPSYQAPAYQASVDQALIHQPLLPQPQIVTTNEFTNFMKANDAILKNVQTNMTSLTNLNLELKNMSGQFMKMNTASSLGLGTLPGNTITNLKEDLKGITIRSRTAYQGPRIPTTSSSPVVERETEATKDMMHPTNNGSTKDIQPSVVPTESQILNSELVVSPIIEPVASPVSASKPNQRPIIPYLSRLHDQKLHDKANDHLLIYKDKLSELSRTPLNKHCPAVLLKKLPEKLGDPSKFLIPCDFPGMAECLDLADLGASINLMPLSVWNKLSLPDLSPTCMTLELANHLISRPVGVVEDVFVKVGIFHFLADFVVVDFDVDPRVLLILGRSFRKTGRALIDVFEGELTLRVGKVAITFNLDQTSRYSADYNDMMANRIDVIDMACEEYSQKFLGFFDVIVSGNLTPYNDPIVSNTSPTLTPFENSDFLLEEVDAFLALEDDPTSPEVDQSYVDTEGNDKLPVIIAKDLSVEEKTTLITVLKSHKRAIAWKLSDIKGIDPEFCTHKILMEEDFEPAVQHQRRVNSKIHDVINNEVLKLLDVGLIYPICDSPWEKTTFTCPYRAFAYHRMPFGLCNAPDTFQRCMMAIFHDMIEKTMEVFIDDFSVFWNSFQTYLSHLEKMLKRCEDTNLCLNWEKSHFMVKEGIVLGHKISKNGIEVDKAKVDVIAKLPHPTTVKDIPFELKCDASDFAIGAVLGQRQEKHFRPIHYANKTMTEAESNYTTTEKEMLSVVFETPRAIISDRGTHFCNDQFAKVMLKFGVTHRLATSYHPQRSGQMGLTKHQLGVLRTSLFLERRVISPIELEHKAYWALKHANFDPQTAGDHRKVQLNEVRDQAYENSLIYKKKTKRLHDSKIKDRVFNIGDRVLLFNSRLKIFSGKLKSRWSGPFTISHVFPYGTVELSQPDEPNFKVTGHRLKHYFGEDVPKMVVHDLQTFPKDQ
nr:hypothetical protein [Tanacetum cinerariifolium]